MNGNGNWCSRVISTEQLFDIHSKLQALIKLSCSVLCLGLPCKILLQNLLFHTIVPSREDLSPQFSFTPSTDCHSTFNCLWQGALSLVFQCSKRRLKYHHYHIIVQGFDSDSICCLHPHVLVYTTVLHPFVPSSHRYLMLMKFIE